MTERRPLTPEIARRFTVDTEPYLSCDDCFDLVDRYVEQLLDGVETDAPALRAHLAGCGACEEEARSLLLLVAAEQGLDPTPALARLAGSA
jgi:hypothetical protein